jgi:diaminopimelate decarboxylase
MHHPPGRWLLDDAGYSLVTVGSISNGDDYPLYYCTDANTTDNFCG